MRYSFLIPFVLIATAFGADHPGNVFVTGEDVRITVPESWSAWQAVDIDGREVGGGTGPSAALGPLPVGYFEVRQPDGAERVTAAVLPKIALSESTPIAIDAAMSWFYASPQQVDDAKMRAACALCRLAGVSWVRDRLSWPEIETARGTWADTGRYEHAMQLQREEGLKILQVNHISPPWATDNPTRFPHDLRDVYNFYRGLAKRWNGLADAIEPWNEPDIELFGGHTGCEIASFQKAAYLGLKAGDPQRPVCQSVFAIDRAETLDEFGANEVYPYFEIYNLHHYIGMPAYSRAYGRHRAVSGGRPMWTTEFNLPVHWADEATKEPSDEELRVQAFRVGKVFATALYEGSEKAFYFILGDYVERNLQYGLVHHDLTPRPAYVAFAAVGRLLQDARPIGRVDFGDDKLLGYVFKTRVDGAERETLVAWSETHPTVVDVPSIQSACDFLGRELQTDGKIELTRQTVFLVLPPGTSKELQVVPPPKKPAWRAGDACPVVLQLIGDGDFMQSAFRLGNERSLRLVAYNFGSQPARGQLDLTGAACSDSQLELAPGAREERTITVEDSDSLTVRLDLGDVGTAIVFARVTNGPKAPPTQ